MRGLQPRFGRAGGCESATVVIASATLWTLRCGFVQTAEGKTKACSDYDGLSRPFAVVRQESCVLVLSRSADFAQNPTRVTTTCQTGGAPHAARHDHNASDGVPDAPRAGGVAIACRMRHTPLRVTSRCVAEAAPRCAAARAAGCGGEG